MQLSQAGLIAFIANGSVLARKSSTSDEPMGYQDAVPFRSPPSLEVILSTPNKGKMRGMGIKKGVTLIVGGGFNGKSTLLKAIETGVYNKIPGDGREFVVSDPGAVKIRAEDGRRVDVVDISPFITSLPYGKETNTFSTPSISGTIAQAANIQEALEVGATTLLLDEDTCAANLMIRDERIQRLVSSEMEPICPFIMHMRALANNGVSTVLATGTSGQYFDVADCAICMDSYRARDFTEEAKLILSGFSPSPIVRNVNARTYPDTIKRSLAPTNKYKEPMTTVQSRTTVDFDDVNLDLAAVEQIVDVSQTRAIAEAVLYVQSGATNHGPFNKRSLAYILDCIEHEIDRKGLDALNPHMKLANLARPRRFEIVAALNRLRSLKMLQLVQTRYD